MWLVPKLHPEERVIGADQSELLAQHPEHLQAPPTLRAYGGGAVEITGDDDLQIGGQHSLGGTNRIQHVLFISGSQRKHDCKHHSSPRQARCLCHCVNPLPSLNIGYLVSIAYVSGWGWVERTRLLAHAPHCGAMITAGEWR